MHKLNWFKMAVLLGLAFSVTLTSCGDDDDDEDDNAPAPTRSELVVGSWLVTADVSDSSGTIRDNYAMEDACNKDDITTVKADGTLIFDEGATKCDPDDPQTETGTWTLTNNDRTITFTPNSFPIAITYTLVSVDATTMVLTTTFLEDEGWTQRVTFAKQ